MGIIESGELSGLSRLIKYSGYLVEVDKQKERRGVPNSLEQHQEGSELL